MTGKANKERQRMFDEDTRRTAAQLTSTELTMLTDDQLARRYAQMYTVADVYMADGAPATCASRLRWAAQTADEIARRRSVALDSLDDDRRSDG